MITVIVATVAALGVATVAGVLLNSRSGDVREIHSESVGGSRGGAPDITPINNDTADLGLSDTGPTVVHFSAPWCGPCDRVRRVVDQVCDDLGNVAHVEIDLDANPVVARRFSVLSLPTTLIFDGDGRQRYRASGVPRAADLRSALQPLLA